MKIVVIDDEIDLREMIQESLVIAGYDVVVADNGMTGLDVIRAERPDLIICDVRMPEMDGDELFEAVRRSNKALGCIPFIFLTGDAREHEKISRLNKGADNCLDKPIDLRLLSAYVNAHLSGVTRISGYFKEQLDTIVAAFPQSVAQDFKEYTLLHGNVSSYVEMIASLVKKFTGDSSPKGRAVTGEILNCLDCQNDLSSHLEKAGISRLDYVSFCLNEYEARKSLARTTNGEDLSWVLIFLVAKAHINDEKIPVSDLYVTAPSAKSTINARINSLIEDGVLHKVNDKDDGRRQLVALTDKFSKDLFDHIDASVRKIRRVAFSGTSDVFAKR